MVKTLNESGGDQERVKDRGNPRWITVFRESTLTLQAG